MSIFFYSAYGFGSSLVFHRLETIVRRAYADAFTLALAQTVLHRAEVEAFAKLLLRSQILGRGRILEFATRHGLMPPSSSGPQEASSR